MPIYTGQECTTRVSLDTVGEGCNCLGAGM